MVQSPNHLYLFTVPNIVIEEMPVVMKMATSQSITDPAVVVTISSPPDTIMAPTEGSSEHATETTSLLGRRRDEERYSVFTSTQKRLIIISASIASTFSP